MDDVDVKVAVAVLETKYETISSRVEEIRNEMRTGMAVVNTKLDGIVQQLATQHEVSKIRGRAIGFFSHAITGVLTLAAGMLLAKILHIPVSL